MASKELKQKRRLKKVLGKWAIVLVVYFTVIVINQDLMIFPGVVRSMLKTRGPNPTEVVETFLETKDGRKIDVWALSSNGNTSEKKKVALILHGNGGDISTFYHFQVWFREQGYTSYDFDYAGYGKSTGWMSEKRIYQDAETVLRFVAVQEKLPIEDIVIFGISIGSGPSAYLAQLVQSKVLMIASGYSSLPDVVRSRALFSFLAPFVRYQFPTSSYLEKLKGSCVVLSHGKKDDVISYDNSLRLEASASKNNTVHFISSEAGRHNDTFWENSAQIAEALKKCEIREEILQ